jgi:mycothione reductase
MTTHTLEVPGRERTRTHDLVVIGTGSGNSIIDERFDDLDVAIVERGVFGGTCLNVGCIPTKMYVYPADVAETVRQASRYGVDASIDKVRWTDIRERVFGRIDPIADGGRAYRVERCSNVTVYEGDARFVGHKTLAVERNDGRGVDLIRANRVVIAAGSRPAVPELVLRSGTPFHTSDTIMRIDEVPDRLAILGSGFIAAEFAHVFSALGASVSIIGRSAHMLRTHDEAISQRFSTIAAGKWDLHMGHEVTRLAGTESGLEIELTDSTLIRADMLLVAVGRTPNGDLLDVEKTGVPMRADGRVVVDDEQRCPVPGIFALGDVSSPYQLKHVANREAKVVAHNLLHPLSPMHTSHAVVPSAVFTSPQIAAVGRTEQECRADGYDYVASTQSYGDVAFGWASEDATGFCKVLADRRSGLLLGAHVMGPQASSIIQPIVQAMSFGLAAREMASGQYWIHPGLPEVIENALLGLKL